MVMLTLRMLLKSELIFHAYTRRLCVILYVLNTVLYRHELSVLPGSPVKGVSITTSTNGAYEMMKQGLGVESEGYEVIDVQQRGGPTLTGVEAAYELPSIPDQPLPDTPSPLCKTGQEKDDDEDGVYETIPGDN